MAQLESKFTVAYALLQDLTLCMHLRQSRRVLRSKTAELVQQEFYGWVLAHYAVRWLLHQGATRHRIPHEALSFTGHVQLLRRAQPRSGAFPPRAPKTSTTMVQ